VTAAALAGATIAAPSPARAQPARSLPLQGKTFALDPGHNGGNADAPGVINRLVNVITERKACDTTGTATDAGYTEAAFNFDVAMRVAKILRARGARVVLTRTSNTGVGPCITQRAAIGNLAHATAAISIHADGAPASGYGFHVIEPAAVGPNDKIVKPSAVLGVDIRNAVHKETGEAYSTYVGHNALIVRSDLGGLNLSTVPKVFIESGNMRNAADARKLTNPAYRQKEAQAIADGLTYFAEHQPASR
jgi:N-acetylmuramoyl-L-alanine amidase